LITQQSTLKARALDSEVSNENTKQQSKAKRRTGVTDMFAVALHIKE
jgi:hypothetical protein